jgi:hypothetical protein
MKTWILLGIAALLVIASSIGGYMWGMPRYRVYSQKMQGEAELAQASYSKQTQVQQAQAELDAAKLRAQAIATIGAAAKEYPEYRQQEFIGAFADAMREGKMQQIIYVPTEANIPITEARNPATPAQGK